MAFSPNPNLFVESFGGGLRAGSAITDLIRRKRDDRELSRLAQLAKSGDYEGLGAGLVGMGEVGAGIQATNVPYQREQQRLQQDFQNQTMLDNRAFRERDWNADQSYRNATLQLQQLKAEQDAASANTREAPAGYEYTETGLRAIPGGPADPTAVEALETARAGAKNRNRKPSAFEMKEISDADGTVASSRSVVANMQDAIKLNDKAFSGYAASARGYGAAQLGIDGGSETELLGNIIKGGALESLKATFGASPTEGERAILLDIQGAPEKDPKTREAIFTRAMAASLARAELNQRKAKTLRDGTYFEAEFEDVPYDFSMFMPQAEKMVKEIKAQNKTNDSKGQEKLPPVVTPVPGATPAPEGVDPAIWAVMTPEERAAWQ